MAGVSRMFYEGVKTVKNFVKAKLNIPSMPAGQTPSPTFRQTGKNPGDKSGYKPDTDK